MTLWDTIGEQVQPGDILRLKGGYSTIYIDLLNLYVGKVGQIEKIGEFTFNFVENPNLSYLQWSIDPNNPKHMIGTPPKGQPNQQQLPVITTQIPFKAQLKQAPQLQQQQQQLLQQQQQVSGGGATNKTDR
eukprot:gene6761-8385_t